MKYHKRNKDPLYGTFFGSPAHRKASRESKESVNYYQIIQEHRRTNSAKPATMKHKESKANLMFASISKDDFSKRMKGVVKDVI